MTRTIPSSSQCGFVELTSRSGVRIQVRPDGGLFAIRHGATLINQVLPTAAERGMHRLLLRRHAPRGIVVADLPRDAAAFRLEDARTACWYGVAGGVAYRVSLRLHAEEPFWLWQATLRNERSCPGAFDLVYGQDLGLADEAAMRGNEAFLSQYMDHSVIRHPRWKCVLLSRQNLAQAGNAHPWLAQGCLDGCAGWCTDGFQFFGLGHRLSGVPEGCRRSCLGRRRLQYEFAYTALQARRFELVPRGETTVTFFALYQPDHAAASGPADLAEIVRTLGAGRRPKRGVLAPHAPAPVPPRPSAPHGQTAQFSAPPLVGEELTAGEWKRLFPGKWRQIERDAQRKLLSFFHAEMRHVVARRKELLVERSHGHLLRSGRALWLSRDALGSTVYAGGIFNAQVYLGNTNLARGVSVVRNALDVMASSGQRVFVRRATPATLPAGGNSAPPPASRVTDAWQRLGTPSCFEIGRNDARWIYRLGATRIEAVTCMDEARPRVTLTLRVTEGPPCEFLVTHLLVMGEREMDQAVLLEADAAAARIVCAPDPASLLGAKWPAIRFAIAAGCAADVAACGGDELLFEDGRTRHAPYAVLQSRAVRAFAVTIEGIPGGDGGAQTAAAHTEGGGDWLCGLPELRHRAAGHVAEALPWLAQNACMHLTAPRGLEQYGGAAWGVRDVCQGPVEWLLATRQVAAVRRILAEVFRQQYADTHTWPQWFMFDPFRFIQGTHAHGDVPFWPVKALCDYAEASGDLAFLDERIPYTDRAGFADIGPREPVLRHAMRVVDVFESRRIPGTALVNYGEGDWDDTLQPADPALRTSMVSAWTVALAYHVFRLLRNLCARAGRTAEGARLDALLTAMRADFGRYLLPGGVLAGFLVFDRRPPRPLLHPRDRVTGIRYRLLPMTRAVLAELLTPRQAAQHMARIRRHLRFPDGVRLMSSPVPYRGGVARWFQRAETAANFGREIGLMYTHAHLRYIEALAKLGCGEELWEMLGRVTPVQLRQRVAHAAWRQANAYFSSSDGAFADRYEAARHFRALRRGKVAVKGGWRVYSSGPGLYLHRVICSLLGLRDAFGDLVVDPVLPQALNGLVAAIPRDGRSIEVRYTVGPHGHGVRRIVLNGEEMPLDRREANPYREGGVCLAAADVAARLKPDGNRMRIVVA